MTDQNAQEPTMEEILASIRRIISEDDAPAETAPAPAAALEPEPQPEPAPSPAMMDETPSVQAEAEDDVFDLTDRYEAPAHESIGDLDVSVAEPDPFPAAVHSESAYAPPPEPQPAPVSAAHEPLVGDAAASSASSAFAGLAASLRRPEPSEPTVSAGPTIDELARSLLRPMLKEWLDANLPAIVEAQVRKEVERIARNAA